MPSNWDTMKGGGAFDDPSLYQPSDGPIQFDSNNDRQVGAGNQSFEIETTIRGPNEPSGATMLRDLSSETDEPENLRLDMCVMSIDNSNRTNAADSSSAGAAFAIKDEVGFLAAELSFGVGIEKYQIGHHFDYSDYDVIYQEGAISGGSAINDEWFLLRFDISQAGSQDYLVEAGHAPLSDFKANGESAISDSVSHRFTPPNDRRADLGVGFCGQIASAGDEPFYVDGIKLSWP